MSGLDAALSALTALGSAYRGDWSEVDGRSIRSELESMAGIIRKAATGEDVTGDIASFASLSNLCLDCRSWRHHCDCQNRRPLPHA